MLKNVFTTHILVSGKEGIALQTCHHLQHDYVWLIQTNTTGMTSSLGSWQEIMITVLA